MNSKHVNIAILLVGITVGAILRGFLCNNQPARILQHPNVFFLGVTIKFKTVQDKEEFKDLFRPMAEYVAKNEFNTLSYEMMESDKLNTQVYILERYKTKEDYLEVHRKSKEFLYFREKLQGMLANGATLEGESYIENGIGFI